MKALDWYLQSSTVVGFPVLAILLCYGTEKMTFELTCRLAAYQCERSLSYHEEKISMALDPVAAEDVETQRQACIETAHRLGQSDKVCKAKG